MRFLVLILLLHSASSLLASGVWFRAPHDVLGPLAHENFRPDFVILKWGIFSTNGTLTPSQDPKNMTTLCRLKIPITAWIIHRLSKGKSLTPESGRKLGTELNGSIAAPCFSEVELDIEPLPEPPPWLKSFLQGVRKSLNPHFKLRLTIPPVSEKTLKGMSWLPTRALQLLEDVDGLDVMNYDTGSGELFEYERLIEKAFSFARYLLETYPGKTLVLGFPAYREKTRLHQPSIENSATVFRALQGLGKDLKFVCDNRLKFAYYAGWTMEKTDRKFAEKIENWRRNACY